MADTGVAATAAGIEAFGYKQELKRSLSLADLLVYGLVFISPTAPIPVFGIVFNASKGMVPLIYFIGMIAMVFTALSYMAMARAFPVAGSVYSYAARSLGETAGFFAGWALLLDYLLLPTLAYVVCAIALHSMLPGIPEALWVVGLIVFSTVVNYFGIETTARANFILLALQIVIVVVFAAAAIVALAKGVGGAHLTAAPLFNPKVMSPSLVFGALSLAVLSFLGFDAVSTLSEEARGGSPAIARATILSLVLCASLFMAQTYLASLFVPGRTSFAARTASGEAFYTVASIVGGNWLKIVVAIPGVVLGAIACALSAQAATARLLFSMARDGKLPRRLSQVQPVRKVPEQAVLVVAAVTIVLGIFLVDKLELLTSMVSFGALIGFLLLHASVMVHFRREAAGNIWRYVVAPIVGLVIIGYVLWNAEANAKIAGCLWLAAGAAYYLSLRILARPTAVPIP